MADLNELNAALKATLTLITDKEDWYRKHKEWAMCGSISVRLAGFIALSYGAILPILSIERDFRLPYISLILGGLIMLLDNLFMFTKSWSRYAGAELALKAAREQLNANWKVAESSKSFCEPPQSTDALQMLAKATTATNDLVIAETGVWQEDLDQALKELNAKMNSVTDDVAARRAKYESERLAQKAKTEEDAELGGVNVNLSSAGEALIDVIAKVGTQAQRAGSLPAIFGFQSLAPGIKMIQVDAMRPDGKKMPTQSQVFQVKSGQIEIVNIKLPY